MIGDYVAAVRELQPVGPYHIAGWSAGGVVAYALAEALERAGEEVALFAMFDAPLPSTFRGVNVDDDAQFLCELVSFASRFSGTDIQIDHEELTKLAPEEQFQFALAEARKTGIVPAETPEAYIRRLVRAGEANVRVLQGYEPNALAAPIRLFVPTSKTALEGLAGIAPASDEDRGWSSYDGQVVEIQEVPGDHFTMMLGEGAAVIAEHLNKLLAAVRAGIASRNRRRGDATHPAFRATCHGSLSQTACHCYQRLDAIVTTTLRGPCGAIAKPARFNCTWASRVSSPGLRCSFQSPTQRSARFAKPRFAPSLLLCEAQP